MKDLENYLSMVILRGGGLMLMKTIFITYRKPKQMDHCNYISKSYLWITQQNYKIDAFKREVTIENIRADALYKIKDNNKDGYLIVEVELSNNNIYKKLMKYEDFFISRKYKKIF